VKEMGYHTTKPMNGGTTVREHSTFSRKVKLAFVSAILILFVAGAVSYRSMVVASESDLWVRHTHEVLEALSGLLSTLGTCS
jgi:CHASE3 domain sensor protein